MLKSIKTLQEAPQNVSIFYEIIFREFFIYFLVDVADVKNVFYACNAYYVET